MAIGHKCKLCRDTGMIPVGTSGSGEDGNATIYEDCDCGIVDKWIWMMEYCRKHAIPPAQTWAWNKAEKAYAARRQ